jgi:hypothetical protein
MTVWVLSPGVIEYNEDHGDGFAVCANCGKRLWKGERINISFWAEGLQHQMAGYSPAKMVVYCSKCRKI